MKFDVAIWRTWSFSQSVSFLPDYFGSIEAPSAFLAIVGMMRLHRLGLVPHATAIACNGSLAYRVYRLRLAPAAATATEDHQKGREQKSIKQASLWL